MRITILWWTNEDRMNQKLAALQRAHNKLLMIFLNRKIISDRMNTKILLANVNMLSVIQINAKIKLTAAWRQK